MKLRTDDVLWATAVKTRDEYTCRRVFVAENHAPETARRGLHAHHIFGRGRQSTRHVVENGVTLCYACHRWAHSNPFEFHEWIKGELGAEVYGDLQARSQKLKSKV